jgi:hypothetical protein
MNFDRILGPAAGSRRLRTGGIKSTTDGLQSIDLYAKKSDSQTTHSFSVLQDTIHTLSWWERRGRILLRTACFVKSPYAPSFRGTDAVSDFWRGINCVST